MQSRSAQTANRGPLLDSGNDFFAEIGIVDYRCLAIGGISWELKKYDIPLYKHDNRQYAVHRVLKVRESDYVLCGDNQSAKERESLTGKVSVF